MVSMTENLRELEEQLLRPDVRHSREQVAALLADEFREFGSSGRIYDKQQILEELEDEGPARLSLSEFATVELAPGIVLATYQSSRQLGENESGEPEIRSLRSSLWMLRDGRWQMLFHQGTRIPAEE